MPTEFDWSGPYPLYPPPHRDLQVDSRPGIYRIRAFGQNRKPLHISRFSGSELLGILHIGESSNLRRRIQEFRHSIEGRWRHQAGNEFDYWGFSKVVPQVLLRFDYIYVDTKQDAIEIETRLHVEYRNRYLDRPPLDGTSGRASSRPL